MRKFLLKSLLFVCPLILFAYSIQPIIDNALRKTNCSSNYKEWNDILDSKINADLIIQGSSRAWLHISPESLDSALSLNSYNLGINGYPFQMQYYRFQIYLKYNKKPNCIIQTTDYFTLNRNPDLFMSEQFIPYLRYKCIRQAVINFNGLDYRDFFIPLYKYIHNQSLFLNALISLMGSSFPSNGKYKGFQAQDQYWDTSFIHFKKNHPNGFTDPPDTMTLRLFDNFVKYCIRNDIKLIFVNSPTYFEAIPLLLNRNEIDSIYLSYSEKFNIPYLDYSKDSICFDTLNFYNSQHLNVLGVQKFNIKLANDLKRIIK